MTAGSHDPHLNGGAEMLVLAGLVFVWCGHFSVKNALEEYYNCVEPMDVYLNGALTFLFNIFYVQHHFTRIREWKQSDRPYVRPPSQLADSDRDRASIIYPEPDGAPMAKSSWEIDLF